MKIEKGRLETLKKIMLNNHLYNLFLQLVQEHKSWWRIKNNYLEDAGDCEECQSFWRELQKAKEVQIAKMEELIKKHLS